MTTFFNFQFLTDDIIHINSQLNFAREMYAYGNVTQLMFCGFLLILHSPCGLGATHWFHFPNHYLKSTTISSLIQVYSNDCMWFDEFFNTYFSAIIVNNTNNDTGNVNCTQINSAESSSLASAKAICKKQMYPFNGDCGAIQHFVFYPWSNNSNSNNNYNNNLGLTFTDILNNPSLLVHYTLIYNVSQVYLNNQENFDSSITEDAIRQLMIDKVANYETILKTSHQISEYTKNDNILEYNYKLLSNHISFGIGLTDIDFDYQILSKNCQNVVKTNVFQDVAAPQVLDAILAYYSYDLLYKNNYTQFESLIIMYDSSFGGTYCLNRNEMDIDSIESEIGDVYYDDDDESEYVIDYTVSFFNTNNDTNITVIADFFYEYYWSVIFQRFYLCHIETLLIEPRMSLTTLMIFESKSDWFNSKYSKFDLLFYNFSDNQTLICFVISICLTSLFLMIGMKLFAKQSCDSNNNFYEKLLIQNVINIYQIVLFYLNLIAVIGCILYFYKIERGKHCHSSLVQTWKGVLIFYGTFNVLRFLGIIVTEQLCNLRIISFINDKHDCQNKKFDKYYTCHEKKYYHHTNCKSNKIRKNPNRIFDKFLEYVMYVIAFVVGTEFTNLLIEGITLDCNINEYRCDTGKSNRYYYVIAIVLWSTLVFGVFLRNQSVKLSLYNFMSINNDNKLEATGKNQIANNAVPVTNNATKKCYSYNYNYTESCKHNARTLGIICVFVVIGAGIEVLKLISELTNAMNMAEIVVHAMGWFMGAIYALKPMTNNNYLFLVYVILSCCVTSIYFFK